MAKHLDLARAWVAGEKPKMTLGNMSFKDDKVFSYGTMIARKVTVAGKTAVLVNSMQYSTSTSAHRGAVLCAIKGKFEWFFVPNLYLDHAYNLRHYQMLADDYTGKLATARTAQKHWWFMIQRTEKEQREYRAFFMLDVERNAA